MQASQCSRRMACHRIIWLFPVDRKPVKGSCAEGSRKIKNSNWPMLGVATDSCLRESHPQRESSSLDFVHLIAFAGLYEWGHKPTRLLGRTMAIFLISVLVVERRLLTKCPSNRFP